MKANDYIALNYFLNQLGIKSARRNSILRFNGADIVMPGSYSRQITLDNGNTK